MARVFSARLVQQRLHLRVVLRLRHRRFLQLQPGNLLLEALRSSNQRAHRRIAGVDRERILGASGPEEDRRGEVALAGAAGALVEGGVLGEQQPFLLKRLHDLRLGVLERFADRHMAVAIAIRGGVAEGFDERLGDRASRCARRRSWSR
jgi:hypothetical protein